jgi:antitoxin (DNA-binding transcriptional repressor) of toxin-antitoxin stability system
MEATMHEAKTNLSKLVARALAGEEVILTHGKTRTPMVRMVPMQPVPAQPEMKERPIGFFAAEMGPDSGYDWSEPMSEEELALWEAPIVSNWKNNQGDPKDAE